MLQKMLENVRMTNPLIHNITNYVTVNDCANIILASGASPIMADDKNEVSEISSLCQGLVVNIGTLNSRTIASMLIAGKESNKNNHPVVLDPVGVGASKFRTETVKQFLEEVTVTVIRGNISEIKALAVGKGRARGVDANIADQITEDNLSEAITFLKAYAEKVRAVIVVTGAIDIVTDGQTAYCIRNGHPMMSSVTGTGCQLSALIGAFVVANPDYPLEASVAAVVSMGYAGQLAFERLTDKDGNATYRNYIIDAIYRMTPDLLEKGAHYDIR